MEEPAIRVSDVSKTFKLPHEKTSSVKSSLVNIWRHKKGYEIQEALKGISFEVSKGEFFGIVGRNGSGKSTLLKIIAGIYQPTKGTVGVNGKLVPFIELGVGFNPELTGRENVYLNGALLGFSNKEVDKMYDSIVKFAELERFMDQKLKNYSSGMQVRLAFSMAIRARAEVLLIDEVLAVGDAAFQRKCYAFFSDLKRRGTTVIFVSHDMGAVQQYCDRAVLIENSKILEIGNSGKISTMYSKLFIQNHHSKTPISKSGEERWGDGAAKWDKVKVDLEKGRDDLDPAWVDIHCVGKAIKNIEYPIFGFSIKDDRFNQLLGSNTNRLRKKIAPLRKDEMFELTWKVRNIFNEGTYYVDCTIAHDDASVVSDRWPEAAEFSVTRIDHNPYQLYTDIEFSSDKVVKR